MKIDINQNISPLLSSIIFPTEKFRSEIWNALKTVNQYNQVVLHQWYFEQVLFANAPFQDILTSHNKLVLSLDMPPIFST